MKAQSDVDTDLVIDVDVDVLLMYLTELPDSGLPDLKECSEFGLTSL